MESPGSWTFTQCSGTYFNCNMYTVPSAFKETVFANRKCNDCSSDLQVPCTVTGSPYQGSTICTSHSAMIDCGCLLWAGDGWVIARMLAFVINGLKTGLLFLAVSVNPNPQTRRGHSRLLGKHRRNKRHPSLFPVTRETQNAGSCPILGRPSSKGLKVHKPHKHFHSSPVPNLLKVGCVLYPESSLAARPLWTFCEGSGWRGPSGICTKAAVPNFFSTEDQFRGRQFFHRLGGGGGLGLIQAHYTDCAVHLISNPMLTPIWQDVSDCSPVVGDPCCKGSLFGTPFPPQFSSWIQQSLPEHFYHLSGLWWGWS